MDVMNVVNVLLKKSPEGHAGVGMWDCLESPSGCLRFESLIRLWSKTSVDVRGQRRESN